MLFVEDACPTAIQSLLSPDISVGGTNGLSIGIGFSAVSGQFTP